MKLIDKDALVAEIEKMLQEEYPCDNSEQTVGYHYALYKLQDFLDTLKVKEVDYDKEVTEYLNNFGNANIGYRLNLRRCAKHFFELGLSASNPITATDRGTAEEIIINLKRVEKDYRISLTKEIEWVRNQVKKGE